MRTAGTALTLLAALCFVPTVVQRISRRRAARVAAVRRHEWADARLEAELRRITDQRDRYWRLYHDAVRTNAALLEHIGEERAAAAADALNDTPAYFEAKAAREARTLDAEWLDLDMSEGER